WLPSLDAILTTLLPLPMPLSPPIPSSPSHPPLAQDLINRRLVSSGHDVSDGGINPAILEMAFAGNTGVTVDLPSPADLIGRRLIASGHDVSDGGIITAILEMAFAGNTGVTVDLPSPAAAAGKAEGEDEEEEEVDVFGALFAEELGLMIEVAPANQDEVLRTLSAAQVPAAVIGQVTSPSSTPAAPPLLSVAVVGVPVLGGESMPAWRDVWEESSFLLEQMQRTETCATAEREGLKHRKEPSWKLPFTPSRTAQELLTATTKPRVAVLREEGSNGDREMAAAVWAAGMEPWDVTVSDLLQGRARLDDFRGIIFVGGFRCVPAGVLFSVSVGLCAYCECLCVCTLSGWTTSEESSLWAASGACLLECCLL
ncbi:unnamed protein product, partial [Closterium sp. NIES-53]